jgi:hypothetical protein
MKVKISRYFWLIPLLFSAVLMACNLTPSPTAITTPEPTLDKTMTATQTATPTHLPPLPTPEATTSPTSTPEGVETEEGCRLNADFLSDVTIPDDTPMMPGEAFHKTWEMKNNGTCDWQPGTLLVFIDGDALSAPPSLLAPAAAAGDTVNLSVDFVAPMAPGAYRSEWQLQTPDDIRFGDTIYVQIIVVAPTATSIPPTRTTGPTPTPPTSTPTPECIEPDEIFEPVLEQAEELDMEIACAVDDPYTVEGASQQYWSNVTHPNPHLHYRSFMIWRADTEQIYALDGWDTGAFQAWVNVHQDMWEESEPEVAPACETIEPPEGYIMPVRGFGKVWCANNYSTSLGWPSDPEDAVTLTIQETSRGLLMDVDSSFAPYQVAMNLQTGQATVYLGE